MLSSRSILGFFALLSLSTQTFAQREEWNIIQEPFDGNTTAGNDPGGYSLFLLRGNVASQDCKVTTAFKQYGCVFVAECVGEKQAFKQCEGGTYFPKGTVSTCQEVVETIGKYNLVNYTMYCIDDYSFDIERLEGNSTVSYEEVIKSVKAKAATLGKPVGSEAASPSKTQATATASGTESSSSSATTTCTKNKTVIRKRKPTTVTNDIMPRTGTRTKPKTSRRITRTASSTCTRSTSSRRTAKSKPTTATSAARK